MNENWRSVMRSFFESKSFERVLVVLIILNSITLGIETFSFADNHALPFVNTICTIVFTIEIILKIIVYRGEIFKDKWNVFDIIVVGLSLIPEITFFSAARTVRALRTFRVLRTFRLVPHVKELQKIIRAVVTALPGIGWTVCLMFIVYYIYAVVGTNLFSGISPEYFGNLWKTLYTLFQLTMADDLGNITRPVIEQNGVAVIYFISFAIIAVLIVLNLIIGIIVDSIEEARRQDDKSDEGEDNIYIVIEQIEEKLENLKRLAAERESD